MIQPSKPAVDVSKSDKIDASEMLKQEAVQNVAKTEQSRVKSIRANTMKTRSDTLNSSLDSSLIIAAIPELSAVVANLEGCQRKSRNIPITRNSSNNSSGNQSASQPQVNFSNSIDASEPKITRYLGSSMQVRSEQKATKVLGVVFFTFVICWSPFFVINFTQAFVDREQLAKYISNELMTTFLWLGYISSTINPVIYTVFNRNFRLAFRQLLLCRQANHTRYSNRSRNSDLNKSFRFSQYQTRSQYLSNGGPNNASFYSGFGTRSSVQSKVNAALLLQRNRSEDQIPATSGQQKPKMSNSAKDTLLSFEDINSAATDRAACLRASNQSAQQASSKLLAEIKDEPNATRKPQTRIGDAMRSAMENSNMLLANLIRHLPRPN